MESGTRNSGAKVGSRAMCRASQEGWKGAERGRGRIGGMVARLGMHDYGKTKRGRASGVR